MLDVDVFNAEVINYEGEHDGGPFVSPEARGHIKLVVSASLRHFSRSLLARMPDWGRL